jgi:mannose-6-phosphate isomerase-like protein (cupin superfamily)
MRPALKRHEPGTEYYSAEGCYITEVSNSAADPEASIARARRAGRDGTLAPAEGTAERYVIVKGRGRVEVDELGAHEIKPGNVVLIPPMCRQRIANIGKTQLVFLAVCTPRFEGRSYQDLEKQ